MKVPSLAVSWIMAVSIAAGPAGAADPPRVSTTGSFEVEGPPERVRMTVSFREAGPTLKDALPLLEKRRDDLEKSIRSLAPLQGSITTGPVEFRRAEKGSNREMAAIMRRLQGGKAAKPKGERTTASSTLTADWPLRGNGRDEQMREVAQLEAKLAQAVVATAKVDESEDEDDPAPEMSMISSFTGDATKAAPVKVSFVRDVTDADVARATREAWARARTAAEKLAAATGSSLGRMISVSHTGYSVSSGEDEDRYSGRAVVQWGDDAASSPKGREVVRRWLEPLRYRVTVQASFDLGPK